MRSSLVIGCLILVGCSGTNDKPKVEAGEMLTTSSVDTCNCEELIDSSKVFYMNDIPFTGVCIHNYPASEQAYMIKGILNGKLHGKVKYYDKQGQLIMEELYDMGNNKRNSQNAPINCDCSELVIKSIPNEPIKRSFLDEIPFTGTCTKYYPGTQQKYMDVKYESGILNGFTTYYDKTGNVLYMEKYERGELLKVIHD